MNQVEVIRDGTVDVGYLRLPVDERGLEIEPLFSEPRGWRCCRLITGSRASLARRQRRPRRHRHRRLLLPPAAPPGPPAARDPALQNELPGYSHRDTAVPGHSAGHRTRGEYLLLHGYSAQKDSSQSL